MNTTNHHNRDEPEVRVSHRPDGWTLPALDPDPQPCTTNHQPDPTPCANTAVWKVVELRELGATLSFWCHTHLPAEHRQTTPA